MVKVEFSTRLNDTLPKPEIDGIGIFIVFLTSLSLIFPALLNRYFWIFFLLSIGVSIFLYFIPKNIKIKNIKNLFYFKFIGVFIGSINLLVCSILMYVNDRNYIPSIAALFIIVFIVLTIMEVIISKKNSNSIKFNNAIKSNIFNIKEQPTFVLDIWSNHIKEKDVKIISTPYDKIMWFFLFPIIPIVFFGKNAVGVSVVLSKYTVGFLEYDFIISVCGFILFGLALIFNKLAIIGFMTFLQAWNISKECDQSERLTL